MVTFEFISELSSILFCIWRLVSRTSSVILQVYSDIVYSTLRPRDRVVLKMTTCFTREFLLFKKLSCERAQQYNRINLSLKSRILLSIRVRVNMRYFSIFGRDFDQSLFIDACTRRVSGSTYDFRRNAFVTETCDG